MKLTLLLSILTISQLWATETYSQITKLTLKLEDIKISDALKEIENQSEFFFLYSPKLIDVERKVNITTDKETIKDILTNIFGENVKFAVYDRQVILTPSDITSLPAAMQQLKITGTVTDASTGEFIPGVNVVIKGTTVGIMTDASGKYTLGVPNASVTLQFSFIGYITQEVVMGGQTTLNVALTSDIAQLSEVVVIGYGTQKKVNLTGAVSQVDSKVLESRAITNLGQGLQGVIANLNISPTSGAPGSEVLFNIRGTTSISGGNPLILVDGVQMNSNLINPQDIKSISVLKDAASAAIYGSRAAFGVILITTKSGLKSQKPIVSFSSTYSINKPTVVPDYLNSIEYTTWINTATTNTNGIPYLDDETMQHVNAYFNDPENNLPVFHHSKDALNFYRYSGNTNWTKELFKESYPMQQYTLNLSGGTENVTYYTSLGYFNQKGVSKPGDENYDRYNFKQDINYSVNNWLRVGAKATLNNFNNRMNPTNNWGAYGNDAIFLSGDSRPLMPVKNPDGSYAGYSGDKYLTNPVAFIKQGGYQIDKVTDLWLTGEMKLTPIKSLTININYTYNIYNDNYLSHMKSYMDYDANGPAVIFPHTNPNRVTKNNRNNKYASFNAYAEYEKTFVTKNYVKGMIGFNQELGQNSWFQAQRRQLISNDIPYMNLAYGERYANDSGSEYAIRGFFARLNYAFDERYLFEFNGRYDGSSRFPKNDRFKFFPSASVGWRISNEAFFENLKSIVNELKFRVSYGNLGNQVVSTYTPNSRMFTVFSTVDVYDQDPLQEIYYPYVASYGTAEVNYILGGTKPMSVTASGLVSPTLTWEKVRQYNFGIDFALLNNSLQGTFDIYRRDVNDMLTTSKSLPSILGVNEPQSNAANLKTNGFELTLSHNKKFENGLSLITTLILADAHSVITKYDNPDGILSNYYVGQEVGEIWGFVTEGLFQSDEEASGQDQSQINARKFLAGDIKFKDLTGDHKITRGSRTLADHGDLTIIGNSTPRYSYGIKEDLAWKGFDLNIFFQGVMKRNQNIQDLEYFLLQYNNMWKVPQKINLDYWSPTNPDAFFPRPRVGVAGEVREIQSRFLQNSAYLRLKQLTIGYTIPTILTQKAGIEICRVYFAGGNLWEYSKMLKIFDPEVISTRNYPIARSYSLGLNVTF